MTMKLVGRSGVAVEHLGWNGTLNLILPDRVEEVFHCDHKEPGLPELTYNEVVKIFREIENKECLDSVKSDEECLDEGDSNKSVTVKQEIYDATEEKQVLIDSLLDRDKSGKSVNAMDCDVQVSPEGATNFKIQDVITLKPCDYNKSLQLFKEGMHCSQEVIISYVNKEQHDQILGSFKIVEVNLSQLKELFQHTSLVTIKKIPPKKAILDYFENNDVSSKRCLVKCVNLVHGIVLAVKWREISDGSVSEKKANNTFSNFQRTDRTAGRMLVDRFLQKNCMSECSGYKEIESKSGISFDIYDKFGFLTYASDRMAVQHMVFYNNGRNIYFIKDKYLDAFGKIVVPKKKKIKRLQKH